VRIIAGEFRGRKLLPPASDATRPITDRAKQSLFDILAPLLADAVVYDCFAGTGSMGLESLSRGAAKAVFFERDRSALKRLQENIATLGVFDRAVVMPGDIFRAVGATGSIPPDAAQATVVFLDPPYRFLNEKPDQLRQFAADLARHHMTRDGILVFRHDQKDQLELADFTGYDQRSYGSMQIELLRPKPL
jgi:16S rRNA (guanine966-N2)-methyltransferase